MLKTMLKEFGFPVATVSKNSWCGTFNVEVVSHRASASLAKAEFLRRAAAYLQNFLLNADESEMRIHSVWMVSFSEQLERGWAK
jgi:hypothetical protein